MWKPFCSWDENEEIGKTIWRRALQIFFFGVWRALSQKIIIMMSLQSDNEECICDVVVLEQPRCPLVCSALTRLIHWAKRHLLLTMNLWQENQVLVWGGCQLRTSHLSRMEGQLRWLHSWQIQPTRWTSRLSASCWQTSHLKLFMERARQLGTQAR